MSTANVNPDTGIRYGVISGNNLNADVLNDLFYGPGARNVSEEAAEDEGRKQIEADVRREFECGDFTDEAGIPDEVETRLDRWREHWDGVEEPTIEGEYDGVKYRISHLGGAPLVWIIEGPTGIARSLCSPCVPNAADLDSGFIVEAAGDPLEDPPVDRSGWHYCYVCPRDWAAGE